MKKLEEKTTCNAIHIILVSLQQLRKLFADFAKIEVESVSEEEKLNKIINRAFGLNSLYLAELCIKH